MDIEHSHAMNRDETHSPSSKYITKQVYVILHNNFHVYLKREIRVSIREIGTRNVRRLKQGNVRQNGIQAVFLPECP